MKNQKLNISIRKVALNSAFRMLEATEEYKSLNSEVLHLMIDIAILEEGANFENNTAKELFIKSVLKILNKEYNALFKKFYTDINDRVLI
jgi:hypothetical protein